MFGFLVLAVKDALIRTPPMFIKEKAPALKSNRALPLGKRRRFSKKSEESGTSFSNSASLCNENSACILLFHPRRRSPAY